MKNNNKKIRIIICIVFAFAIIIYLMFFKGFYAFSDKIVGPYVDAESYKDFLDYDSWQIGENKYGDPIFCYEDNAFQFLKNRYKDVFIEIYEKYHNEYNVGKLNKNNFKVYKNILINIGSNDIEHNDLIRLFELYENGQKRWIYVIGEGWNRIYK